VISVGDQEVEMDRTATRMVNLEPWTALTPQLESWLVDGLVAALPSLRMAELFALRRDMFRDADLITVAVDEHDRAVGALCSRWAKLSSGTPFLHVTTQFVGERYRQTATFRHSWAVHLNRVSGPEYYDFPPLLVLKTYNPSVLCSMRGLRRLPGVSVYPAVDGQPTDAATEDLAAEIAQLVSRGHRFDPATGVIRDAGVPSDLYPDLPRSADRAVNDYFAANVSPSDRVLCMLAVSTRAAVLAVRRLFASVSADVTHIETVSAAGSAGAPRTRPAGMPMAGLSRGAAS
jgi:hypothetical protein